MSVRAGLLLSLLTAAATAATPNHVELVGMIRDSSVSELSGAAVSQRDAQRVFAINDSKNAPDLQVITRDGAALGHVRVNGVRNQDWEDLAAFNYQGQPHLLIADTGDNGGLRAHLSLIVVAEPEWPLPAAIDVAWRINFRLPEGARDIEAVAVDAASDTVYLIAKRHFPRVLYRLPLHPEDLDQMLIAKNLGTFNTLPPANDVEKKRDPRFGRFQGDITALALDPNGGYALVLSYRDLYLYPRKPGEPLLRSFSRKPMRLHVPPMPQAEAIALDADAGKALVVSERLLAPIYQVAIPPMITAH